MKARLDAESQPVSRILRFDGVQRAAHWANALLFGVLMVTALPLYFPSLSGVVGRRALVANIHVWSGVVLPLPVLISLLGPWGARMRRDLRRINVWTKDEVRWLRMLGLNAPRVVDKFNPGQKLNAIFIGGSIVVMLATGFMLKWFRFFPVSWRTGRHVRPRRFGLRHLRRGHRSYSLCRDPSRSDALDDQGVGNRVMGRPERPRVVAGGEIKIGGRRAAVTLGRRSCSMGSSAVGIRSRLLHPLLPCGGAGVPDRSSG